MKPESLGVISWPEGIEKEDIAPVVLKTAE
jgi:hypothetical protein